MAGSLTQCVVGGEQNSAGAAVSAEIRCCTESHTARSSMCSETLRSIEADLEDFSSGQVAAHGRREEGKRALSTFMCTHMTHATRRLVGKVQPVVQR